MGFEGWWIKQDLPELMMEDRVSKFLDWNGKMGFFEKVRKLEAVTELKALEVQPCPTVPSRLELV